MDKENQGGSWLTHVHHLEKWPIIQTVFFGIYSVIVYCMNATGGYDGSNFLSSIECYNVSEDRWTEEGNMACGRSGHGVAVATEPSYEYVFVLFDLKCDWSGWSNPIIGFHSCVLCW